MTTASAPTSSATPAKRFALLLAVALLLTLAASALSAQLIHPGSALSALAGGGLVALAGLALSVWMFRSIGGDPRAVPKAWFIATGLLFLVVAAGGPALILAANMEPAAVLLTGFLIYMVTLGFGAWQVRRSLLGPAPHQSQEAAS